MQNSDPTTDVIPAGADMTDWQSVRDLQLRCESSLPRTRRRVVLDLSRVTGADSKLIACVVVALRRTRARSLRLEIKPSACVRKWIDICRLEDLLLGKTVTSNYSRGRRVSARVDDSRPRK